MRILFVVHQFYPEFTTGTEAITLNLAKACQRAGHFARIVTCRTGEWSGHGKHLLTEESHQGIPITAFHRISLAHNADLSLVSAPEIEEEIVRLIHQEEFDLAHVLHTMRMGPVLDAIQRTNLPYVLSLTDFFAQCFRINMIDAEGNVCGAPDSGRQCQKVCQRPPWTAGSLRERYERFLKLLGGASARVCPSTFVADTFLDENPHLEFQVIEHGVDLIRAASAISLERPDGGTIRLGYFGTFVPEKGVDGLVAAFVRSPGKHLELHLHGDFFGDEARADEIRLIVAEDDRVHLHDFVDPADIFERLASMDVLCLPSIVPETFSLILREAASVGTPALVSDLGAPAAYVNQTGGGAVISAHDTDLWRDAIVSLSTDRIAEWSKRLPLPYRIEEESFLYQSVYQKALWALRKF